MGGRLLWSFFLLGASSVGGSKEFFIGMGQFRSGEPELGRSQ